MSEQTLMELLVGEIHNLSNLKDTEGNFRDIATWAGVDIGDDGRVEVISLCIDVGFALFGDDWEPVEAIIGPHGSIDF